MRPQNNNNYFSQNIKEYGEDFLKFKNPRTLEIESNKIFRDLAKNSVQINKYGNYFLDKDFIMILIKQANKKYIYYNVCYNGIYTMAHLQPQVAQDKDVLGTLESINRSRSAYEILINCFIAIQNTGDYKNLYSLSSQLNQFRYDL